jgi:uncharacterized protein (DUF2235 family)
MAKQIVFCADGTWNNPYQDEDRDQNPEPTNVYKLFLQLDGEFCPESIRNADEQEKALVCEGAPLQVAKYIHGVGDSRNPILKLLGGAFGAGIISRIVRGYTFISRNFEAGDAISIVGFSRGAYTARALAGLIAAQGLLAKGLTQDQESAYRCGAQAWYRFRRDAGHCAIQEALTEVVADLPAFLSSGTLRDGDLAPVEGLSCVGVWDTVGAMGFPEYAGNGQRLDAFRFADTALSPLVRRGFHAVALDERRGDFGPTLWDPAPHVTQVLFPGAHGDVGGGYPTDNRESGLSDRALAWMTAHLEAEGVRFDPATPPPRPDPVGTAHQPWRHGPWRLLPQAARSFPAGLELDDSIGARLRAGPVLADPGEPPADYRPLNLP